MYFFTFVPEYTLIIIHDHTNIIEAVNEMCKCMSLTKSPPPIVINAAMIVIFGRRRSNWCLWHTLSRTIIKGVLPFYPAQYVQKSDVGLYMICQKRRHLLGSAAANAHMAQREDQPAKCTHKKNVWQLNPTCPICMRKAPFMIMRQEQYQKIQWVIQVAKPVYRPYQISNLQCSFLHPCPRTRES